MKNKILDVNGRIFDFQYEFNFKIRNDLFNRTCNAKCTGDSYKVKCGTFASPMGEFTKDEVLKKLQEGEWYDLRILDALY